MLPDPPGRPKQIFPAATRLRKPFWVRHCPLQAQKPRYGPDLLHELSQKSSESAKEEVRGDNYFKKILDFWKNHCKSGQLFMEFIKGGCLNIIGKL